MAQVTSKRNDKTPSINKAVRHIQKVISVASGDANSGDNIEVFTQPVGQSGFLHRMSVRVSATLGAGATLTGQVYNGTTHTAVTGATTAGAAGKVDSDSDADVPLALLGGEKFELAVGGANIGASATITVDLYLSA